MTDLLDRQPWRSRVAELLNDPVVQAVLRRDRLTKAGVMAELAPIADHLRSERQRRSGEA